MLFCSPAGNDLLFDEALCEQGRNFCNKIWNALRLIKGWEIDDKAKQDDASRLAVAWFHSKFNETLTTIDDHYSKFRISDALMSVYKLVWDDFCSSYLEAIKPAYQEPIDTETYKETIDILEGLLKVLHPFMPFISEEIWHLIGERKENESIVIASWPVAGEIDVQLLEEFEDATEVIKELRTIRKEKNIAFKESLRLLVGEKEGAKRTFDPIISKLTNLETIEFVSAKPENALTFVCGATEYYVEMDWEVDSEAEAKKLTAELEYTKGFLNSIVAKLKNEKFVNNAPEKVVAIERKKQSEAEERIAVLEKQLTTLN